MEPSSLFSFTHKQLARLLLLWASVATVLSARGDALDSWTSGSLNISYSPLLSGIAYGAGKYVIVGSYASSDAGILASSSDGLCWSVVRGDFIHEMYDVTYGNGTFVAVGWDWFAGGNLYSSTNAVDWEAHQSSIGNVLSVAFGRGLFVAVGDGVLLNSSFTTNRNIYTSPDGVTWTAQSSGAPRDDVRSLVDVAYGASRFVAIDNTGLFYASTSGTTWTRYLTSNTNSNVPTFPSISYCNDRFIALHITGTNLVSTNGLFWTVLEKNITNAFQRVVYDCGRYVALSGSQVFTSLDATNWIRRNLAPPSGATLRDLSFGQSNIVVVGYTRTNYQFEALACTSAPIVGLGIGTNYPPQLSLSGLEGCSYEVEYSDDLGTAANWQLLRTVPLNSSPQIEIDSTAAAAPQRFYRTVLLR